MVGAQFAVGQIPNLRIDRSLRRQRRTARCLLSQVYPNQLRRSRDLFDWDWNARMKPSRCDYHRQWCICLERQRISRVSFLAGGQTSYIDRRYSRAWSFCLDYHWRFVDCQPRKPRSEHLFCGWRIVACWCRRINPTGAMSCPMSRWQRKDHRWRWPHRRRSESDHEELYSAHHTMNFHQLDHADCSIARWWWIYLAMRRERCRETVVSWRFVWPNRYDRPEPLLSPDVRSTCFLSSIVFNQRCQREGNV